MSTTPQWFLDAIAVQPSEHVIDVAGCPIHYLAWGDTHLPGLVLIHGGAAHAHCTRCRIALMRGERSLVVSPEAGEYMYELLNRNAPMVEIPEAHHHLILDQPLAFIAALRALLSAFEHSIPRAAR